MRPSSTSTASRASSTPSAAWTCRWTSPSRATGCSSPRARSTWTARPPLTFVRQRKQLKDGDFARNRHQQALLAAIAAKIISADTLNPIAIRELVDTAAPFMTVDEGLTPSAIASTAYDLRSLRSSDIRYLSVPHAGPMTTDGGASVVGTDEAGMDELPRLSRRTT